MTIDLPEGASHKEIILLKENDEVKPSEHIKIVQISPTTTEIQIVKAKPDDDGNYSVIVNGHKQPLINLKVIPKPVTHQKMDLPQTIFKEGETLTITCEFDSLPEEKFEFFRNGQPLLPDDRITTNINGNTYTILVKNLKPVVDDGVYTIKSDHMILDTPSITVVSEDKQPKKDDTTDTIEVYSLLEKHMNYGM
jgi:Immunoglobulin I-set domain